MADSEKKSGLGAVAIAAIIIVLMAVGYFTYAATKNMSGSKTEQTQTAEEGTLIVGDAEPAPATEEASETPATDTASEAAQGDDESVVRDTKVVEVPSEQPAAEKIVTLPTRSLGSETAPITVTEFSSLTCSHCASFHTETFPEIRKNYIDTGKVRFIFRELPLNKPALDASQILRCLPEDQYVSFMQLLFETQDKWAFEDNYMDKLKQNAKLAGMSDEAFDKCMGDENIRAGLMTNIQEAGKLYQINSTPSFLINGSDEKLI
ncbi:MAG: DsbA family protein, partial [Pseudobdellovibrionaceae bacterium]